MQQRVKLWMDSFHLSVCYLPARNLPRRPVCRTLALRPNSWPDRHICGRHAYNCRCTPQTMARSPECGDIGNCNRIFTILWINMAWVNGCALNVLTLAPLLATLLFPFLSVPANTTATDAPKKLHRGKPANVQLDHIRLVCSCRQAVAANTTAEGAGRNSCWWAQCAT